MWGTLLQYFLQFRGKHWTFLLGRSSSWGNWTMKMVYRKQFDTFSWFLSHLCTCLILLLVTEYFNSVVSTPPPPLTAPSLQTASYLCCKGPTCVWLHSLLHYTHTDTHWIIHPVYHAPHCAFTHSTVTWDKATSRQRDPAQPLHQPFMYLYMCRSPPAAPTSSDTVRGCTISNLRVSTH